MKTLLYSVLAFTIGTSALAKEFERFDGQFYNGQHYPLVDNIEWGEQDKELPHMEFHIHSKGKQVDVAVVPGDKGGKPVFYIMYDLKFRNERICRHILAPAQFKEGTKVYAYRDNSDPDYDNIYFYSFPWVKGKGKNVADYTMPNYERCTDEHASNMPEGKGTAPLATPAPAAPAALPEKPRAPASEGLPPREGGGVPIDYDNTAVPFSF